MTSFDEHSSDASEDELLDNIIGTYNKVKRRKISKYEYSGELTFENGVLKFTKDATFKTLRTPICKLSGIAPKDIKVIDYTDISDVLVGKSYGLYRHFEKLWRLEEIRFGSHFDTSNVHNMAYMFANCYDLRTLDLSSFDTHNVIDMDHMFYGCCKLKSITFGIDFDASKVRDMSCMFSCCRSLTSLNLSTFNASSVEDMSHMFATCELLETLDMSSFTSNVVEDMCYMFGECESLRSLDMRNLSYKLGETDAKDMFHLCCVLSSVIMDLNNYHSAIEHELHKCRESDWWHGTRHSIRPQRATRASTVRNESVVDSSDDSDASSSDVSSERLSEQ